MCKHRVGLSSRLDIEGHMIAAHARFGGHVRSGHRGPHPHLAVFTHRLVALDGRLQRRRRDQTPRGPTGAQTGRHRNVSVPGAPALCQGKSSRARWRNGEIRVQPARERGARAMVDEGDCRVGRGRGGPGDMCASGVPPTPAPFMMCMLQGRPFDFTARGDAQTDPRTRPATCKMWGWLRSVRSNPGRTSRAGEDVRPARSGHRRQQRV